MALPPPMKTPKDKGFNLIEAAIVLAVIGLVVGGIWSAASAVQTNRTVSTITSASVYYMQRMRNIIKNSGSSTIWINSITPTMLKDLQVLPNDWFTPNGASYNVYAPGDIAVYRGGRYSTDLTEQSIGLIFGFADNQRNLCRRLLVALSGDYRNINLIWAFSGSTMIFPFGGSNTTETTLSAPILLNSTGVDTICSATSTATGGPYFHIGWRSY